MIRKILIPLVVLLAVLYGGFQLFGTAIVANAMSQTLGTKVKVQQVHLKFAPVELGIYGVKIMNFKDFEEPVLISIPEVFVRADLAGLFKKTIHIRRVVFDMDKVTVEKNRQGKVNLKVLMDISQQKAKAPSAPAPQQPQAPQEPKAPAPKGPAIKLQIDEAVMSLGKVTYVDYGTGVRNERQFDFNINESVLKNVTDLPSLTEQVSYIILQKIGMLALTTQVEKIAGDLMSDAREKWGSMFPAKTS